MEMGKDRSQACPQKCRVTDQTCPPSKCQPKRSQVTKILVPSDGRSIYRASEHPRGCETVASPWYAGEDCRLSLYFSL